MKIIANAPVPEVARHLFADLGEIEVIDDRHELGVAEVLIVRGERLDAATLDAAPHLKVIARTGAGIDNIDIESATARRIPIVYAPDEGVRPVAEGTLALILATAKRLGELGAVLRRGQWQQRYEYPTLDLRGAILGIVGLGRIGTEVSQLAAALGMSVLATEPDERQARSDGSSAKIVSLERLLAHADIISLHCDLNRTTRGMVDRSFLSRAKRGLILINVARGQVIESDQIVLEALDGGQLAAVGLDVFRDEPPDPQSQLLADPRVVCTPHSVGLTTEWNVRVFRTLAGSVRSVLDGGRPANLANPKALTGGARLGP